MKRKYRIIIFVFSLLLCIICGVYGISLLIENRNQQANFSAMKEEAYGTEAETQETESLTTDFEENTEAVPFGFETEQGPAPEYDFDQYRNDTVQIPIDFGKLKQEYSNVYAWIVVPGTEVDYAIVQHPSDNAFYLNHGYQEEMSYFGAIYTEKLNAADFLDPVTVIYGHNMRDGSMFGSLNRFREETFFQEHREFYIYTENHIYTYQIFAAYDSDAHHILYGKNFSKKREYQDYLNSIYMNRGMNNHFLDEPLATVQDKIVTLSTCSGTDHSVRYLVQGILTDIQ